jgi:hypothetical protein
MTNKKFQSGRVYKMGFIGDAELFTYWFCEYRRGKFCGLVACSNSSESIRKKVHTDDDGNEYVNHGSYSMAPVIRAEKVVAGVDHSAKYWIKLLTSAGVDRITRETDLLDHINVMPQFFREAVHNYDPDNDANANNNLLTSLSVRAGLFTIFTKHGDGIDRIRFGDSVWSYIIELPNFVIDPD